MPATSSSRTPRDPRKAASPLRRGNMFGILLDASASEHMRHGAGDEGGNRERRGVDPRSHPDQANQARQAEITTEISEIVGGAEALRSPRVWLPNRSRTYNLGAST